MKTLFKKLKKINWNNVSYVIGWACIGIIIVLVFFYLNKEMQKENEIELITEQTESVRHFIKALKAGCGCDNYNGFDCGCGKRAFLCDEALKELDRSTCH